MYRREKINRKTLYCILAVMLLSVFTISIAYAALNAVLTISGNAEIVASSWDIHLENPQVKYGSINDELPTITNGNTINFDITFKIPGSFYEFTVDIANDGSIDAMIDNVTNNLTAEQAKYIKFDVNYLNGDAINTKHKIAAKSSLPINVRVEFRREINNIEDMPEGGTELSLSLALTYVQADQTANDVSGNGIYAMNGSLDDIGTVVTIGTEKFYTIGTDGDNVKLLSMYNLLVGGAFYGDWIAYQDGGSGIQNETARGWFEPDHPDHGITAFSETGTEYSGSLVEGYVNNYKSYIQSLGIEVIEARLLTIEELTDPNTFACDKAEYTCENTQYPWIYSTTYWTSSARNEWYVWAVAYNGHLWWSEEYDSLNNCGVRPVLVIPKDNIVL